ncbi:MAG: hypothetical protein ACQEWE_21460 [Bacillota bacterium]
MKSRLIQDSPQMRVWLQEFNHPDEHLEMLEKFKIGREFNLRSRGLIEYYGIDLIDYKREQMANKKRNEFLTAFAHYMTDHLEDECPRSWKECPPSFWEELIFAYLPHTMKVVPKKNYTEQFLLQLRKFVRWLDKRNDTTFLEVVDPYISQASPTLKKNEALFSELFLINYPGLHLPDWDYINEIERLDIRMEEFDETTYGVFEVTKIMGDGVILLDLHSHYSYFTKSIPHEKVDLEMIITGCFGKKEHAFLWDLAFIDGIYPKRAFNYIQLSE